MNAVNYLTLASKYDLTDLRQSVQRFFEKKFMVFLEHPSFVRLNVDDLVAFLGGNKIKIESERNVFDAAAKWIDHDLEGRRSHVDALMKTIRMSKIDYEVRWDVYIIFFYLMSINCFCSS